jgi:predicted enzyme related to lactoylglutathione lyase
MTPDVEMARRFYPAVLGWEARDADPTFGGYFMFFHDDLPAAGAMPDVAGGAMPSAWTPYVAVEDAASSLAAVSAHGGSVVSDAMEVGTLGVMGIFVDPSGAAAGVWQPRDFPGFGAIDEPGAARWFELHTRDFATSKAFFEETFGWSTSIMSDSDDFRYATANEGEAQFAGINDTSRHDDASPSRWLIYFGVTSCDDAVTTARAHGASIVMGPEDTPYGRLAVITDPAGATFAVMQ